MVAKTKIESTEQVLRIATRQSPLALWQAEHVKGRLQAMHPGLRVELIGMTTRGDVMLDSPLAKIGGKALFVKELELAMLEGRADIAVHSMKDVPMDFPDGLGLSVILAREDPRDAFVSNHFNSVDDLPVGACVGTSSLRRQCQLRARRPDLKVKDLRGNVNTRLKKLDQGEFDAVILAAAGLVRLELKGRIREWLSPEDSLPACGQGAVGIECLQADKSIQALLAPLNDEKTSIRVRAERAMNHHLAGGCQVPIAGYAEIDGEQLVLSSLVGRPDGTRVIRAHGQGGLDKPEDLGIAVGKDLLAQGAGEILQAVYGADEP